MPGLVSQGSDQVGIFKKLWFEGAGPSSGGASSNSLKFADTYQVGDSELVLNCHLAVAQTHKKILTIWNEICMIENLMLRKGPLAVMEPNKPMIKFQPQCS